MGPGQKFLTQVGSAMVWLRVWKISQFFNFFPSVHKNLFGLGQKVPGSKTGWPLIYCGLKVMLGLGQSPSLTITNLELESLVKDLKLICIFEIKIIRSFEKDKKFDHRQSSMIKLVKNKNCFIKHYWKKNPSYKILNHYLVVCFSNSLIWSHKVLYFSVLQK